MHSEIHYPEELIPVLVRLTRVQMQLTQAILSAHAADEKGREQFSIIMLRLNASQIDHVLLLLHGNSESQRLSVLSRLSPARMGMVCALPPDKFELLFSYVVRFNQNELDALCGFLEDVPVAEVLLVLVGNERPVSCRLCAQQRSAGVHFAWTHNLESRRVSAPAVDRFAADDEAPLTVSLTDGMVLFDGQVLDLVNICEECLAQVHRFLASVSRFEPLHHLPPLDRKRVLTSLRKAEAQSADVFAKIARFTTLRRLKEWVEQTLIIVRTRENIVQKEQLAEIEKQRLREQQDEQKQQRETMIREALAADAVVVAQDMRATSQAIERRKLYAAMMTVPSYASPGKEYGVEAPALTEHPLSWKHAHMDIEGLPRSAKGASCVFGRSQLVVKDELKVLSSWRDEAMALLESWHAREQDKEAKQRDKVRQEAEDLNKYAQNRSCHIDYQHALKMKRKARDREAELQRRRDEKTLRRQERQLAREALERDAMSSEEILMRELMGLEAERARELRERLCMYQQEAQQTRIDRFWGIPTAHEQVLRRQYEQLRMLELEIERKRRVMVGVGNIQDTPWAPLTGIQVLRL